MSIAAISRFVLRHKLLVGIAWAVIAVAGFVSTGPASGALSDRFDLPGSESTETNAAIAEVYGNGGDAQPLVAVVTLPDGTTVDSPGVTEELGAAFARVSETAPPVRVVSYASTGDRAFVSEDGRTTFGLLYPTYAGPGSDAPETPAIREAIGGASVAGAGFALTGMGEIDNGGEGEEGESGVLVETLAGGLGALVVLVWIFGSFLAFLPLLMAAIAIVTTFLLVLAFVALPPAPDTTVKIMATGLAAGIFLDAMIVRALLVPATVSLMGKWNWWLPGWLERFVPAAKRPGREGMVSSEGASAD